VTTPAAPLLVVLAGPNGAGKSTFFDLFLRATGLRFVNADLIAQAIAPGRQMESAYAAAKAADLERQSLVERRESFCMETVFSDTAGAKLSFLAAARAAGYRVELIYIGLESVELSQARVIQRTLLGGHDVPHEKLQARFPRTLANLKAALGSVDSVDLFDNSDAEAPYKLIARIEQGRLVYRSPSAPGWCVHLLD
jgi:predicted ABC-type ATPase